MIERALILVSQTAKQKPKKTGRIYPLLGGLTPAERPAYQVAKEKGKKVVFVGAKDVSEVLSRSPGPSVEMEALGMDSTEGLFDSDDSTPILLIRGDRIYGNEIISQGLALTPEQGELLTLVEPNPKGRMEGSLGILAATPKTLATLLNKTNDSQKELNDPNYVAEKLEEAARSAETLKEIPYEKGYWHKVETTSDWIPARNALFRSLGKPIDGFISRHFNRPVSQFFSKHLCNLPFTPNQISAVVFLIGLSAAALMATGQWLWIAVSAFVFHMASVLDGVDGEIARVKFQSTKFGALLDSILDHIVMVAWILAAGYVLTYLRGEGFLWMGAAYVCLFCTAVGSAMVNYNQITKTRGGQPMELQWDFDKEENKNKLSSKIINSVRFFVSRDMDCVVLGILAALNIIKPVVMLSSVVSVVYFFIVLGHQIKRLFVKKKAVPS